MATASESKAPKIKLHWLNGSRAQGILWLLEELHVPYELEIYHRGKDMLAPPELAKVHPLGKSPVVTITPAAESGPDAAGKQQQQAPIVLAETGFITKYMCDHYGQHDKKGGKKGLMPKRWREGREGQVGGETEEWMRCQYLLHYAEGSYMPYMVLALVVNALKGPMVPFLIRPISSAIASRLSDMLVFPNVRKNLAFLEKQLETSPQGGSYLCGPELTAADVVMAFPLLAGKDDYAAMGKWEKGSPQKTFPKVWAYMARLENEDGWKRSAEKIRSIEGKFSVAP